ncbi:MAG: hypothetical protein AVO35_07685 [Candidatus Aegiribacteria sp. MLS_C]|nr:MAG: hypothetical protein AVO35_07685 [Candidatus Aegiribacteria sp. MLS_C]
MSMTGNKFKLGLFFFFGIMGTVVLTVWLSGGFREQNNTMYVSYFPWSVQGLNRGSNVMYNGVPVGRVAGVDIAPDGRLVEVRMEIRSDFGIDSTIRATMQLIGITGLQVINLSAESAGGYVEPEYSFDPEFTVIPVEEGTIQTATSTILGLTRMLNEMDFKALNDQLMELLENTNAILSKERVERLETALLSNSQNLDELLVIYSRLGADLDRLVLRLETAAPDLAAGLDSLVTEISSLTGPLGRLAVELDEFIVESSETLRNLSGLLEMLRNDPAGFLVRTSGEGVWQ